MRASLLLSLAGLVGCASPAVNDQERQALMEADRAFARATAESRIEGWVSYFADDGVMFRPGGHVTGRDAIRELITEVFADSSFVLSWEPVDAAISASADLGYTFGRYESRRVSAGEPVTQTGSYVTIWRRQSDGTWKVAVDIGNPDNL